jgi:hypothetical protein
MTETVRTLTYEDWHYTLIREVFGQRGVDLAMRANVVVSTDGRDCTKFDEAQAFICHTARGLGDPYTVIHEFAHLYHVINWPEISAVAPTERCEAAAILAEIRLQRKIPQLRERLPARAATWGMPTRLMLSRMPPGDDFDLHDEMAKTLSGAYG